MPTGRTIALILLLSAPLAFAGIAPAAVWVTVLGDLAVALLALLDWLALRRIAQVEAERAKWQRARRCAAPFGGERFFADRPIRRGRP